MPPSLPHTNTPLILPELPLKYRRKSGQNMSPIVSYRDSPDFYSASSSPLSSSFLHPFSPVSSPVQAPHVIKKSSWELLPSSSPSSPWQIDSHRITKRPRLDSFDYHQPPFLLRGGSVEDEPTLMSDVEPSEFSEDNDQSFCHDDEIVISKHEDLLGPGVKIVESPILFFDGDVQSVEKVDSDTFKASASSYHCVGNTDVDIANTLLDFSREARIIPSESYSHSRQNPSQRLAPLPHLPISFSIESQCQMQSHFNDRVPAVGPISRTEFVEDMHHVSLQGTEDIAENVSAKECSPDTEYHPNRVQTILCSSRNVRLGKPEGSTALVPIGNMPAVTSASETFHSVYPMNNTKPYAEIHPAPTRSIEIIDLHVTRHSQPGQLLLSNVKTKNEWVAPISSLIEPENLTKSEAYQTPSTLNVAPESQKYAPILDVTHLIHSSSSRCSEPETLKLSSPASERKARSLSPNLQPLPSPSVLNQHPQVHQHKAAEPEFPLKHVSETYHEHCRSQLSPRAASPLLTVSSAVGEPRQIFIESNSEMKDDSSTRMTMGSDKSIEIANTAQDNSTATKDTSNTEHCPVAPMPHAENESSLSLTQEVRGLLIQAMAVSRASSLPASSLQREIMRDAPHLSTVLMEAEVSSASSQRNKKLWLQRVNEILNSYPEFGRIDRKGNDAAGKPLEPHWFYIPENDDDRDRAALLVEMMPKKRNETKKHKQYYYRPLSKISRWDAEDDV